MKERNFPRIEDKLRLFIACVERGKPPPEWLMEYMAGGATEFLKGGKSWQSNSGRSKKMNIVRLCDVYILNCLGGMLPKDCAAILAPDAEGRDTSRTIRRQIAEAKAFNWLGDWRFLLSERLAHWLSVDSRLVGDTAWRKLRDASAAMLRDEQEPGFE